MSSSAPAPVTAKPCAAVTPDVAPPPVTARSLDAWLADKKHLDVHKAREKVADAFARLSVRPWSEAGPEQRSTYNWLHKYATSKGFNCIWVSYERLAELGYQTDYPKNWNGREPKPLSARTLKKRIQEIVDLGWAIRIKISRWWLIIPVLAGLVPVSNPVVPAQAPAVSVTFPVFMPEGVPTSVSDTLPAVSDTRGDVFDTPPLPSPIYKTQGSTHSPTHSDIRNNTHKEAVPGAASDMPGVAVVEKKEARDKMYRKGIVQAMRSFPQREEQPWTQKEEALLEELLAAARCAALRTASGQNGEFGGLTVGTARKWVRAFSQSPEKVRRLRHVVLCLSHAPAVDHIGKWMNVGLFKRDYELPDAALPVSPADEREAEREKALAARRVAVQRWREEAKDDGELREDVNEEEDDAPESVAGVVAAAFASAPAPRTGPAPLEEWQREGRAAYEFLKSKAGRSQSVLEFYWQGMEAQLRKEGFVSLQDAPAEAKARAWMSEAQSHGWPGGGPLCPP